MAIEFLGFTIWVHSDGKELEEYKVQVEDENTVSCYIPSEVGKEFTIGWRDHSGLSKSVVACYMDGRPVAGKPSHRGFRGLIDGVYTDNNKFRPFTFSYLITTDDDDLADPEGADPDLGCIQVEIHRVQGGAMAKDKARAESHGNVQDVGPVHERSKKLGAHCVSLGMEQNSRPTEFMAPKYTGNGPYAVFRFLYRPLELLKARGIVPPPDESLDRKPTIDVKPDIKPDLSQPNVDQSLQEYRKPNPDIKPDISVKQEGGEAGSRTLRSGRVRSHAAVESAKSHKLTAKERKALKQAARVKTEPAGIQDVSLVKEEPA